MANRRRGEEDDEFIENLDATTVDIASAKDLSRYGIANSVRRGNIAAMRSAANSNMLTRRMRDFHFDLRNFWREFGKFRCCTAMRIVVTKNYCFELRVLGGSIFLLPQLSPKGADHTVCYGGSEIRPRNKRPYTMA